MDVQERLQLEYSHKTLFCQRQGLHMEFSLAAPAVLPCLFMITRAPAEEKKKEATNNK